MYSPNSTLFLCSLLIALQLATSTEKPPPDDIVKQTCQKCSQTGSYNLSYDFCYSSLTSVPVSSALTNLPGLAIVAMELALNNATNTASMITGMLDDQSAPGPQCRACLETCLDLYSGMSTILQGCVEEFLSQQYDPVYLWISAIMQAPAICEAGFREKGEEPPLTREYYALTQLCGISLCVIDLISPALKSQSPSLTKLI